MGQKSVVSKNGNGLNKSMANYNSASLVGDGIGQNERTISKILNKNLNDIKESLKKADTQRLGAISLNTIREIMRKFGVTIQSYEKFKKGDNLIDYIKLLKFYL